MRTPEEIAAIIDRYRDDVLKLDAHLKSEITLHELQIFRWVLEGENPTTSEYLSGVWYDHFEKCQIGLEDFLEAAFRLSRKYRSDDSLIDTWDGLLYNAHCYIGAATVLNIRSARLSNGYAILDNRGGPTLWDFTFAELIRAVPKEYRKQLDAASKFDDLKGLFETSKAQADRIEKKVGSLPYGLKAAAKEGAKAGVEGTLPKVYAKTANMSDEELAKLSKPTTRSSGGGRKKVNDLDDKQVKAVIALSPASRPRPLMECCHEIIRKGGDFIKPFKTARSLASGITNYAKRTKTRLTFKARSGRWSAKS